MQRKKFNKGTKQQVAETKLNKYDVLFDLDHIKQLLYSNDFYTKVPEYMNKFFFKYGNNIFFDNGQTFELLTREEARNKIPDQYKRSVTITKNDKEVTTEVSLKSYFGHELFLKTPETKLTIDYLKDYKFVNADFVKGFEVKYNYLNMKKDLPRDYNKKIERTEANQNAVKMFFTHIKNIICSGDEDEFDTVLKFFASSCVGHKVKIALYWQSLEQSGKGTILNYMNDLLGKRMYKTSDLEQVEKYTKHFEGCSLINLDELPVSGTSKSLQDRMKAIITEPKFDCRAMFNQPYEQQNTFNIIITSNNSCISLSLTNNARYYVNTISNDYIGKTEYFKELHTVINQDDVKILIFQEFIKIYNEKVKPFNWIGNNLKPTKAGQLKKIEALPPFYKFIKDCYLKEGLGIDTPCDEFITNYQAQNKNDKTSPNKIGRYLQDLGVEIKDIKKYNPETKKQERIHRRYFISYDSLKQYYTEKNWIDELVDELPEEDCSKKDTFTLEENFNKLNELVVSKDKEIEALRKQILELEKPKKKIIIKQKQSLPEPTKTTMVEVVDDDDIFMTLAQKP